MITRIDKVNFPNVFAIAQDAVGSEAIIFDATMDDDGNMTVVFYPSWIDDETTTLQIPNPVSK